MNITDEILMAYVDGEVDDATREQIERAIAADASLRAKVEQHRSLRKQLSAAFDPVLAEPIPDRLTSLIANTQSGRVTDLSQARAMRDERKTRLYRQPAWMSLAASVVLGIAIGFFAFNERNPAMLVAQADGLIASGELEHALTNKIAADSSAARVHIGISYIAKSGEYCRSFAVTEGAFAGFACRDDAAWRIRMLAPTTVSQSGEFRTASSAMPESVLTAITQDMNGKAFDAEEEAAARKKRWMR
jgi:hypothetical protein